MFCIQQKKGSTIWYYSSIAYPVFTGQEFKGKGALWLLLLLFRHTLDIPAWFWIGVEWRQIQNLKIYCFVEYMFHKMAAEVRSLYWSSFGQRLSRVITPWVFYFFYIVQFALKGSVYIPLFSVCIVKSVVCIGKYVVGCVQCAMCSFQCAVCSVKCAVCSVFLIPLISRKGCNRFYWVRLFSLVYTWWTLFLRVSELKSGGSQYLIHNLTK